MLSKYLGQVHIHENERKNLTKGQKQAVQAEQIQRVTDGTETNTVI